MQGLVFKPTSFSEKVCENSFYSSIFGSGMIAEVMFFLNERLFLEDPIVKNVKNDQNITLI